MKSSDYSVNIVTEAQSVILDQARYIAGRGNPQNDRKWRNSFFRELNQIGNFPYKFPVHYDRFDRPTKYRKVTVQNYIVYYHIDDHSLTVTITVIEPGEMQTEPI